MLVPTGCLAGCIITLKKTCVKATKKAVMFLPEEHRARQELNAALAEGDKVLSIWVATKLKGCQLSISEKSHSTVYGNLPFYLHTALTGKAGILNVASIMEYKIETSQSFLMH